MSDNNLNDSLEPDIAALLDDSLAPSSDVPDFSKLMGEEEDTQEPEFSSENNISESFTEITRFEQEPQKYFYSPNYYKIALSGEGEAAERLHQALARLLKAGENDDKTTFRMRVITIYWDYLRSLATRVGPAMKLPKKLTLRFGALLPTLFSPKQRDMISRIIMDNNTGEPVYYIDEWLHMLGLGRVNPLATDEVQISKQSSDQKLKNSLDKTIGLQETNLAMIQKLQLQQQNVETSLKERISNLTRHSKHSIYTNLQSPMTEAQRASIPQINGLISQLSKIDRDIKLYFDKLSENARDLTRLKGRIKELGGDSAVDTSAQAREVDSLRQMSKLCVGRQGNHFPILMKQYFPSNIMFLGTRENIIKQMANLEKIDPGAYTRSYRQKLNRIVPNVIIVPCFGDRGICWEPYEKYNKGSSRGRIAVPLYPKDLKLAVISAVADLRWQVAKEKAAHYWMEEGLTGHYYDWFSKMKLKGDVKDKFIEDYILWITKESEGMQKLDKEVRAIFWRLTPFPQELKERLKNRGFVYQELYKRDQNRAMSDGY